MCESAGGHVLSQQTCCFITLSQVVCFNKVDGWTKTERPTPLEELAILRDLLASRSGEPIDLADTEGVEEHHPSDNDDEDCPLYNRFLNRLAELFAVERHGKSVTATMMKETEREDRVKVWIARNNGFEGKKCREMVSTVETYLNSLAAVPAEGSSFCLQQAVVWANGTQSLTKRRFWSCGIIYCRFGGQGLVLIVSQRRSSCVITKRTWTPC